MNQIAKSALKQLCSKIEHYKKSGWTSQNNPIKVLIARHDAILYRWPNAYAS